MPQYLYRIIYFTNYLTYKKIINIPICHRYIYLQFIVRFFPSFYNYTISKMIVENYETFHLFTYRLQLCGFFGSYNKSNFLNIAEGSGAPLSILFLETDRLDGSISASKPMFINRIFTSLFTIINIDHFSTDIYQEDNFTYLQGGY